ncbi:hypothetical protein PM3016_6552 [Paenibacillus mucilaginosus 3016]|uniref:Uncharacterized protein n=1 Tax=Paenibacillus mucilaginosus 3016 TaxID=1116391 RepID=H6NKP0_9BACL|nr:hypothetical protein [Paenibacillus mucilaginosus]AFC33177.1 hypothetical protein PM3016_6552 [Paenibacillus mucilaginosus 3016]WFA21606.1 hypothetical protein ERY13_32580 [Paenibacillus mucilaginosus]
MTYLMKPWSRETARRSGGRVLLAGLCSACLGGLYLPDSILFLAGWFDLFGVEDIAGFYRAILTPGGAAAAALGLLLMLPLPAGRWLRLPLLLTGLAGMLVLLAAMVPAVILSVMQAMSFQLEGLLYLLPHLLVGMLSGKALFALLDEVRSLFTRHAPQEEAG